MAKLLDQRKMVIHLDRFLKKKIYTYEECSFEQLEKMLDDTADKKEFIEYFSKKTLVFHPLYGSDLWSEKLAKKIQEKNVERIYKNKIDSLRDLKDSVEDGYIFIEGDRIRVTKRGRMLKGWMGLIEEFLKRYNETRTTISGGVRLSLTLFITLIVGVLGSPYLKPMLHKIIDMVR